MGCLFLSLNFLLWWGPAIACAVYHQWLSGGLFVYIWSLHHDHISEAFEGEELFESWSEYSSRSQAKAEKERRRIEKEEERERERELEYGGEAQVEESIREWKLEELNKDRAKKGLPPVSQLEAPSGRVPSPLGDQGCCLPILGVPVVVLLVIFLPLGLPAKFFIALVSVALIGVVSIAVFRPPS